MAAEWVCEVCGRTSEEANCDRCATSTLVTECADLRRRLARAERIACETNESLIRTRALLALAEAEGARLREALVDMKALIEVEAENYRDGRIYQPHGKHLLHASVSAGCALSSSPIAERAAEVLEAAKRVAEGESAPLVQAVRALRAAEGRGA